MKRERPSLVRSRDGVSYLLPFALVTLLFLLWGFAHGMLDVLNKHFQGAFTMSKAESGLVQFVTYIAYFLVALPAGALMKRFGYKRGILFGLGLFALGAFSFIPAAYEASAVPYLIALFVIACGLCILETAANPYSTVLGPPESAAERLNLSQSFNGLGWNVRPGASLHPRRHRGALSRHRLYVHTFARNKRREAGEYVPGRSLAGQGNDPDAPYLEQPPVPPRRHRAMLLLCRADGHIQFLHQLCYGATAGDKQRPGLAYPRIRGYGAVHDRASDGKLHYAARASCPAPGDVFGGICRLYAPRDGEPWVYFAVCPLPLFLLHVDNVPDDFRPWT